MANDLRIAVDIGGTFTDVVLEEGTRRLTRKLLTTPQRPEEAVLHGVRLILGDAGKGFGDIAVFVHGTTLATNAVIERRGARTALIATEGFRDVLDIANESRYDQYDLTIEKPRPWCPVRCASRCRSAWTCMARCGCRLTRPPSVNSPSSSKPRASKASPSLSCTPTLTLPTSGGCVTC